MAREPLRFTPPEDAAVPPTHSDLAYARVKGPPKDWKRVAVFDAQTGGRIERVIEANAAEGWFLRHAVDPDGKVLRDGPDRVIERIERAILIKRVHGCGAPIRPHPNWKPEPAAPPRPGPAPAPRTPEDGQTVHTPEQGRPFPTRRQPK